MLGSDLVKGFVGPPPPLLPVGRGQGRARQASGYLFQYYSLFIIQLTKSNLFLILYVQQPRCLVIFGRVEVEQVSCVRRMYEQDGRIGWLGNSSWAAGPYNELPATDSLSLFKCPVLSCSPVFFHLPCVRLEPPTWGLFLSNLFQCGRQGVFLLLQG